MAKRDPIALYDFAHIPFGGLVIFFSKLGQMFFGKGKPPVGHAGVLAQGCRLNRDPARTPRIPNELIEKLQSLEELNAVGRECGPRG